MARQKIGKINIAVFDAEPEMERFFRAHFPASKTVLRFFSRSLRERDVKTLADMEVLIVFIHSEIGGNMLRAMPKLRLIATCSTGYDHIDVRACAKRNIAVANVPAYGEDTVAEFTFALLLAVSRRIREAAERTRAGNFSVQNLRGFDLAGKTIGVIGCGKIGFNVIRIANGFGMRVLAHDPVVRASIIKKNRAKPVSLAQLVRMSDIITLHAPLLPSTRHMLGAAQFRLMKKGVVIINTARGGLIDTNALFRALQKGTVRFAGLDVLEGEEAFVEEESQLLHAKFSEAALRTVLEDHVLLHDNRVLITPHIAFNTHEAVERIYAATVNNILAFSRGQPVNLVSAGR